MVTTNAPIPGHHLIDEGAVFPVHRVDRFPRAFEEDEPREFNGGCQCGAKPPGFPNVSRNAMKAWHRQHKEELRGTLPVDPVKLMRHVLDMAEEALRLGDHERMTKVIFVWSQRRVRLLAGEEKWEDEQV